MLAGICLGVLLSACGPAKRPIVDYSSQQEARETIAAFRAWALEPARLPPPGVDPGPLALEGDFKAVARVVRAEDASWNQWGSAKEPLLFNNRVALLFEVDLDAPGNVVWNPDGTWLEVNRPEDRLSAVRSAEHLLADLSWHALQQERFLLEGDLVQRTRHAGGFREAFVRDGEGLHGLIAFTLPEPDRHIGALRLTVAFEVDGTPRSLVWVFQ